MYDIIQRREIAERIAQTELIPEYRRILRLASSPYAGLVDTNSKKLAILLVSALLAIMSKEDILQSVKLPSPSVSAPQESVSALVSAPSNRRSKRREYPGIRWDDMDNPLIRTADSIYTDSVNLGCWLRDNEARLGDNEASADLVAEFAEKSIRLELCYSELRSFSNTGNFLGKHPFIAQRSERERATALLKDNPVEFTRELHRIEMNISRYSSHLNSSKLSSEKKKQAQVNLDKFKAFLSMYEDILKTVIDGQK